MLFPFSLEGAARIWLEKEPPRSIQTWDDLVSKFINKFFPPSKTTNLRNEITRFQTKILETTILLRHWDPISTYFFCIPNNGFSELHQLDTFYNALNSNDQDSLNSAAGGNFLDKMPRDCLRIIKSKAKVRNSCNKPVVAKVSSSTSTPGISFDVAELKDMVKALLLDKKNQSPAPTPVKAVEESCVTCGGAHSYQNFPATNGNVYRDNIQDRRMRVPLQKEPSESHPYTLSSITQVKQLLSLSGVRGGNQLDGQTDSDESLSGNEGDMTLQSVYDLCISLCTQSLDEECILAAKIGRKKSLRKTGSTRSLCSRCGEDKRYRNEEKETADDEVSTEDVLVTANKMTQLDAKKMFVRESLNCIASILVHPVEDEGAATSERPYESNIKPSHHHPRLKPMLSSSGGNLGRLTDQAKEIKHMKAPKQEIKKKAKPVIIHHRAWMKSRKICQAETLITSSLEDPLFDKIPEDTLDNMETKDAQDVGRTRDVVNEEKETADDEVSTEDVLSTAQQKVSTDKQNVSTDRPNVSTDRPKVSTDTEKDSNGNEEVDHEAKVTNQKRFKKKASVITPPQAWMKVFLAAKIARKKSLKKNWIAKEFSGKVTLLYFRLVGNAQLRIEGGPLQKTMRITTYTPAPPSPQVSGGNSWRLQIKAKKLNHLKGTYHEDQEESKPAIIDITHHRAWMKRYARKLQEDWEKEDEQEQDELKKMPTNAALIYKILMTSKKNEVIDFFALTSQAKTREQFTVEERASSLQ
ncbi:reverse transcriptase domain-containing protein [Tanacetum coccineum]